MTEEIKEKLRKTIKIYNEKKKSLKLLVYFTEHPTDDELLLTVTDGVDCWQSNKLDEHFFNRLKSNKATSFKSINKFDEFLDYLDDSLKLNKFEVNQFDNDREKVELKLLANEISFVLNRSSSSKMDIKNLLFNLYANFSKLEEDYNRIQSNRNVSNGHSASTSTQDSIKRFNLGSNSNSSYPASSRKQGYSIINPLNKRRKVPKGVEFDDDEDKDGNEDS